MNSHDILFLLFVLLQLGDIFTTYRIIKFGGRELNPVMAEMFNLFGLLPTLIWIKILAIVAVWWVDNIYLNLVLCVLYVAVVGNNIRQLGK